MKLAILSTALVLILGNQIQAMDHIEEIDNIPMVQFALGKKYEEENDYAKAFDSFKNAASAGMSEAQEILGDYYSSGRGIQKNIDKAIKYYEMAELQSKQDEKESLLSKLISCYFEKFPQSMAPKKILKMNHTKKLLMHITKVAKSDGISIVQMTIASKLLKGKCGHKWPESHEIAIDWFEKAAIRKKSEAKESLQSVAFLLAVTNRFHDKDEVKALKYYKKAAKYNSLEATVALMGIYEKGTFGVKDEIKANKYKLKAIEITENADKDFINELQSKLHKN